MHDEGWLAYQALTSVRHAIAELEPHVRCEVIVSLDSADATTVRAVDAFCGDGSAVCVYQWQVGELASARNKSIERSKGRFIALLDGDDLWSPNWLVNSWKTAIAAESSCEIYHPQYNLYFGRGHQYFFEHIDSHSEEFQIEFLRHTNCWTALSFAERSVYLEHPFLKNEIDKGFGYEDWTWNVRVFEAGYRHRVIADTVHFVRQDGHGSSLSDRTRRHQAIPRVRELYKAA